MLNHLVASTGSYVASFVAADVEVPDNDLNPIALEMKELIWGFGAFAVFAVVLRYAIWPKLNRSIEGRSERIAADHAAAQATTAGAQGDVAEYEAQRAAARAESQLIIDEARAQLEAERSERLAEVNARIAERKAAAAAEVEAAQLAARGEVESAVATVAAAAARLAVGREPASETVRRAVESTVRTGAAR